MINGRVSATTMHEVVIDTEENNVLVALLPTPKDLRGATHPGARLFAECLLFIPSSPHLALLRGEVLELAVASQNLASG